MSNGELSQEEIDQLMKKNSAGDNKKEKLTADEKDIIGEVNNIAMGSSATVLYTLLDREVNITTPEVEIKTFKEITEEYTRPCVLVKVEYVSGLEGVNLLIINLDDAAVIADLMMGGDGEGIEIKELDEIHLSAVGEAMNQMMGSASTSLSDILDDMVNISPPEARYLSLDEAVNEKEEFFSPDKQLVVTSFNLKIGDIVDSSFKQLAPLNFTRQLTNSLQQNTSGLTVESENVQQEQVSAAAEEQQQSVEDEIDSRQSQRTASTKKIDKREAIGVKEARFPEFAEKEEQTLPQNMELLKDVPLEVTVRLGKTRMTIDEILDLGEGSIVELDKLAGEPVDLYVNGKLIAKGEVVVIDENFGFRVKDIINPMDRIIGNM